MSDESRFALLLETTDHVELATAKSLLEGADIPFVVQAEHHHQLAGGLFGNPSIAPRLLVAREALEQAQALLAPRSSPDVADGVCPVHERSAVATCRRCESFLCDRCQVTGDSPLCESCSAGAYEQHAARGQMARSLRKFVALLMLAPMGLALLALVAVAVLRLLGVLPLRP